MWTRLNFTSHHRQVKPRRRRQESAIGTSHGRATRRTNAVNISNAPTHERTNTREPFSMHVGRDPITHARRSVTPPRNRRIRVLPPTTPDRRGVACKLEAARVSPTRKRFPARDRATAVHRSNPASDRERILGHAARILRQPEKSAQCAPPHRPSKAKTARWPTPRPAPIPLPVESPSHGTKFAIAKTGRRARHTALPEAAGHQTRGLRLVGQAVPESVAIAPLRAAATQEDAGQHRLTHRV